MHDGFVLQELPFDVELKKFIVDYYATGMPKLFASEILIHDRDTGQVIPATVKVNEPAFHRGVAIYQSSFDDGGSQLKLRALPMGAGGEPFELEGIVGGEHHAQQCGQQGQLTLEFTKLRVINVENFSAAAGNAPPTCARSTSSARCSSTWAPAPRCARRRSCATSARRSPTSCATPPARRASSTTTCCRSRSTARRCSSPAFATRRPTTSATCASPPTSKAA